MKYHSHDQRSIHDPFYFTLFINLKKFFGQGIPTNPQQEVGDGPAPSLHHSEFCVLFSHSSFILFSYTSENLFHFLSELYKECGFSIGFGDFFFAQDLVQFSSVAQSCPTLCDPMDCTTPGFLSITSSWSVLNFMSIESVIPFNCLILCLPLLLLPSVFPSIRVFSNESVFHTRWPKYWSFNFSISPSNEYSGLISFRIDWLDLLAVQGTLKSLLQHHSSKAAIFRRSAFFTVQLSHPYMTAGKTIALTRRAFVGKVMSLLFNMLSRLVTAFLPS